MLTSVCPSLARLVVTIITPLIYKDLSFEVPRGRILGLLGKNGTGKTTTINILSGYLQPRAGQCLIFGEDIRTMRPETRAHVMVGFYCGKLLLSAKDNAEKIQRLFLIGTILTFAGFLLSYGCPINKKVWSPTFVIITCGLASSFLALLIWIIDMKGYQNWCAFFRSFGVNPLFIYVFAETMGIALGATGVSAFIYEKMLAPALGDYPSSLVYALIYIIFCWSIVHILYKKGIYIKI